MIHQFLAKLGIPTRRDPRLFASQIVFQNGIGDLTGYEGIQWVPFGHYLTISTREGGASTVTVEPLEVSSVDHLYRPELPVEGLIDQAQAEIAENVAALAEGPFQARVCDLSGGLDTRVMLAALLGQGLGDKFGFMTSGGPGSADANVAALIRQRYGLQRCHYVALPHEVNPPFEIAMRSMLSRLYGCFSQHTSTGLGLRSNRRMLHLNGACGETFRGAFSAGLRNGSSALDNRINHVRVYGGLLNPLAREELCEMLRELLLAKENGGFDDAQVADRHYIEHRNRQFVGIQGRARLNFQSLAYPLYSPAAIAASFAGPSRDRRISSVHFALIDRLFPQLLEIPLEGRTWHPDLYGHHSLGAKLAELAAVDAGHPPLIDEPSSPSVAVERQSYPIRADDAEPAQRVRKQEATGEGKHWSLVQLDTALAWLRTNTEQLAQLESLSAIFDLDALREFVQRDPSSFTGAVEVRQIYRLQAAALWLTEQELTVPLEPSN